MSHSKLPGGDAATPPTILVVDDESWNLMLIESVLEDTGYRMMTARSGAEALDLVDDGLVADEPPDVVLLDIMMPGMDGYEVCRRLKASRRTYFIPVLLLTALSDVESSEASKRIAFISCTCSTVSAS